MIAIDQYSELKKAQFSLDEVIHSIQDGMQKIDLDRQQIISKLIGEIHASFHALEFNDEQERYLVHIIESYVGKNDSTSVQFNKVNAILSEVKATLVATNKSLTETPNQNDSTLDIELF